MTIGAEMLTSALPVTVIVGDWSVMLLGSMVIELAPTVSVIFCVAVKLYWPPLLPILMVSLPWTVLVIVPADELRLVGADDAGFVVERLDHQNRVGSAT